MSGVVTRTIGPDDGDQRVDRYIRRLYPHLTQGRIEKMCRKGELRVDGGRVKSNSRVEVGQKVRIPPMPSEAEVAASASLLKHGVTKADAKPLACRIRVRARSSTGLSKQVVMAGRARMKRCIVCIHAM